MIDFGQLVPGDVAFGLVAQRFVVDLVTVTDPHDRDDLVAPTLARPAGDDTVVDRRVGLERRLDLLGEDLLAAGVDRDRVAAVQFDDAAARSSRARSPGHRVADAVDDRIRACGLRPGRRGSRVRVGRSFASQPISSSPGASTRSRSADSTTLPGVISNVPGRRAAADGHVRHLAAGLRRTETVDDHQRRQMGEQLVLQVRRQRGAAREQDRERRQVVRPLSVEFVEQRPGERVADDQQERRVVRVRSSTRCRPGRGGRAPTGRRPCRRRARCESRSSALLRA